MIKRTFFKNLLKWFFIFSGFYIAIVFAVPVGGGEGISTIASNVTTTFSAFARLITAGAFIAGLGFAFIAVLQFKQHRDAPDKTPLGKPVACLFVAVCLLFLPYLVKQAGTTVFGTGATPGTISGEEQISGT